MELAGGTSCVPSFIYFVGMKDLVMGLFKERFGMIMQKKKKKLSKLVPVACFWGSLELNEELFMSCFSWSTFKLETLSFLMNSKRVADCMKKKADQMEALHVAHLNLGILSSTLPANTHTQCTIKFK